MNTIVAPATAPGRSAIGVIRLSGPESLSIAQQLVGSSFQPAPRRPFLQTIVNRNNEVLDRALLTCFIGPDSFTGEDVVEISCHGSPIVLRQILDRALELGARLAEPGEFTLRALANQKLNLSQAEAIRDLIDARSSGAAKQAVRQLSGELTARLSPLKERLLEIIVVLESALEFVEDDLPATQATQVALDLLSIKTDLDQLAETFSVGQLLTDGIKVAIVGPPNVGKSSLFNSLLGMDRAIVTDIPGTTRDSISELISVLGVPISLVDTAGVRDAGDAIEIIGIERTRQAVADADLALVVLDGSIELSADDWRVVDQLDSTPVVIAINKQDLSSFNNPFGRSYDGKIVVQVSALTGTGLTDLRTAILEPFNSDVTDGAGLLITNARHYDLLRRAVAELEASVHQLNEDASEELVLVGLHNALRNLGEITGETTAEDILSRIFATFCIGK
jgi:tRNA modification GTPase